MPTAGRKGGIAKVRRRAAGVELPSAQGSPAESRVRLRSSPEGSGHGSSGHQLPRFIWKTHHSTSEKGHAPTSIPVGLFSNNPLHQPADTELWLNFFPIIKMSKVTYDFILFCITKQTIRICQNPLFLHGKFDLKVAPAQGRRSEGG